MRRQRRAFNSSLRAYGSLGCLAYAPRRFLAIWLEHVGADAPVVAYSVTRDGDASLCNRQPGLLAS